MLERDLEAHFGSECKRLHVMTLKLILMRSRGWPDRIAIKNGIIRFAELKTLKGKLSPMQELRIHQLHQHGIHVDILRTEEQITSWLMTSFQ